MLAIALPLVGRGDADGAERHDRHAPSVVADDLRADVDDLSDHLAVQHHDKVQLRHEGRVVPVAVQHIVLHAAGAIDVPKGLAGQGFGVSIVVLCFRTNDEL